MLFKLHTGKENLIGNELVMLIYARNDFVLTSIQMRYVYLLQLKKKTKLRWNNKSLSTEKRNIKRET